MRLFAEVPARLWRRTAELLLSFARLWRRTVELLLSLARLRRRTVEPRLSFARLRRRTVSARLSFANVCRYPPPACPLLPTARRPTAVAPLPLPERPCNSSAGCRQQRYRLQDIGREHGARGTENGFSYTVDPVPCFATRLLTVNCQL